MATDLIRQIVVAVLLLARSHIHLTCRATIARAQLPETWDSNAKQTNLLKDELYFGLTKPGGEIISESERQEFVKAVITPRFREWLTV